MTKTTESESHYSSLEKALIPDLFDIINNEDQKVAHSIAQSKQQIVDFLEVLVQAMKRGAKLFYIGAGTSGRLGILDASECPPTFGVNHDLVQGLIAGGDAAIRKAVEGAEDSTTQGIKDLMAAGLKPGDVVVGIAASGSTPYVIGAVKASKAMGVTCASLCCNKNSELSKEVEFPIEVVVGPEVVTGSTRMKSGSAQKMVLNMISTIAMIQLGKVKGNRMVDMQLSNQKLVNRGTGMIMLETGISEKEAKSLLLEHGSVRKAIAFYRSKKGS